MVEATVAKNEKLSTEHMMFCFWSKTGETEGILWQIQVVVKQAMSRRTKQ